jgi:transposase InsO family protein
MSRELWLDKATVCKVTGWSVRTVEHKAKLGELASRASQKRGRNGKAEREFAASSLPGEVQAKLMQHRLAQSHIPETQMAIIPHPETHADRQISMFISPPAISDDVRVALSTEQNEIAQRRLEAISPMLEFCKKSNGYKPVVKLGDGREIRNLDSLAAYVAGQRNISRTTLWTWYSRFKEKGFPGLADDVRSDKGLSRFFVDYPRLAELAQAKYLAENLSVKRVHEVLARECGEATPKIDAPCYNTVRAYLSNQIPKPISIMAREGERQHHERCAPFLITDFKSVRANQIWISDHCKHDVWVRNDFFSGLPQHAALRPWVTAIVDMRTRKCMGAVWCANPSSHSISSALRIAIQAWGIPDTFYIDNGKDYASIGRIDFSPEASGVLAQLGIEPQYCIPKHPQSKLIERWFGTMHERFDKLWHPFYCGSSPATRGEECDLALKEHTKILKEGRAHSSPLPAASEFVVMCKDWIEEYNVHHLHTGRNMDGKTPDELFEELLPPEKRRMIEASKSPQALNALFWKVERRRVSEGGCVTIDSQRYEPADPDSGGRLYMEIEKDILIARDPNDLGEALALDLDRRLIGRLQCQKLIARGPISRDDVRAGMRKQREARRAVKSYIEFIGGGHETELDKLRRNSGRMPAERGLPAPPEVMPPLRKVVGLAEPVFIEDMVREFMEKD